MRDNHDGFTLIELLVALLILMVGLLGLLQSINVAMEKSVESVYRNEASVVANERILQCGSLSFNDIVFNKWTTMRRAPRGVFKNYSVQTITTPLTTGPLAADGVTKLANTASTRLDVNVRWTVKNKPYTHSASSVISTSNTQ